MMETATSFWNEEGRRASPLYHSNQVAAFDSSEVRATFASRVAECACRALDAIGTSTAQQQVIFWNLYMTVNVGRNEIADKPERFIEGLTAIYGEAVMVVYEYKLLNEMRKEFGLTDADMKAIQGRGIAGALLHIEKKETHRKPELS